MKHSTKHKRKSETQIRALLNLQEKQDITVTAFCKAHNIHKATFYNWRDKYGAKPARLQEFVPLHFAEHVAGSATLFAEIELPSKVSIRLFQKVEASYFKSLFQS
jgi:transposase-like protein